MEPRKIAIVVPNPCNPDYRVIKQAETFAKAGHDVRIYATKNAQTPSYTVRNGVKYYRTEWNLVEGFMLWITGAFKRESPLAAVRRENMKTLGKAKRESKTSRSQKR